MTGAHGIPAQPKADACPTDHPDEALTTRQALPAYDKPPTAHDKHEERDEPVAVRSSSGRPPAGVAGLGSQGRGLRGRASAIM